MEEKPMGEEQNLLAGKLYRPGDPTLGALKLKAHNLSYAYNRLDQDETDARKAITAELFAEFGEGSFVQGPMYIHYGSHTHIGKRFFGNFNLTIQDDAEVWIGDDCNFGPGVTIVTPQHPLRPEERRSLRDAEGNPAHVCYAQPVRIGNDCWLGANVTVCPGVTSGNGCVSGAGSVVTKDLPDNSVAAGVPARVLREITEKDSAAYYDAEMLGEFHV